MFVRRLERVETVGMAPGRSAAAAAHESPDESAIKTLESLLIDDSNLPANDPKLPNSGPHTQSCVGDYTSTTQRAMRKSRIGSSGMFTILPGGGLEFQDLTYTVMKKVTMENKSVVKKEVNLLHGITGNAAQGEVTAIMGPSGAGKSTFLDALAGRISSGALEGSVMVDGQPVTASEMKILSAYVMQDDQLFPMLTVFETLMFAAEVRLPHQMSTEDKRAKVVHLIDQLGLTGATNTYIGDEGRRGVSGGERRRVSIGVDIIHGPQLLFLDEPTSGLDSTSAFSVVEKLKAIAQAGSTVLLTIHQPSFRIQQLLSKIIILARGRLIYQGPPSSVEAHLLAFGREVPSSENSIEYLLDVIVEYDKSDVGLDPLVQFNLDGKKPMPDHTPQPRTPGQVISRSGELTSIVTVPRFGHVLAEAKGYPNYSNKASRENSPARTPAATPRTGQGQVNDYFDPYDSYDHSLNARDKVPKLAVLFYKDLGEWFDKDRAGAGRTPSRGGLFQTGGAPKTPNYVVRRTPLRVQAPATTTGKIATPNRNSAAAANKLHHLSKSFTPGRTMSESEGTLESDDFDTLSDELIEHRKFANPWFREVKVLMWRNFLNIKRTPELFLSRQMVITTMAFMLATLFKRPPHTVSGATNILSFYIFAVCLLFFSSNDAVPTFIQERFIFIRETSHNAYRSSTYVIANFLVYLPFLAIQAMTFVLITWFVVLNFQGGLQGFMIFWVILYSSLITTNSFVMFVSAMVPNYIMGYAAVIALTALFFLTCGFFLDREHIPRVWIWLHWLSTIKYPYEALVHNQFRKIDCYNNASLPFLPVPGPLVALVPSAIDVAKDCNINGQDILKALAIKGGITTDVGVLLLWGVFYRALFYIILRFYSKNVRN